MNRTFAILGLLIALIGCKSSNIGMNSDFRINDESINLYAFIGEQISIAEFDPNENSTELFVDSITGDTVRKVSYVMDYGFKNTYKVVKNVFNDLKTDTIEFVSYDHYGRPGYEKYENVILYISLDNENGTFYHQKYQFDPVRKMNNGTWKGIKGKSIEKLFNKKKDGIFTARGLWQKK